MKNKSKRTFFIIDSQFEQYKENKRQEAAELANGRKVTRFRVSQNDELAELFEDTYEAPEGDSDGDGVGED
jgi:hypothetical protein